MSLRRIRTYPDPVLQRRCSEVEAFGEELRRLARDMVETMHAAPGIGLAAPQVGDGRRLAVVDLSAGQEEGALHILVNPEIREARGTTTELEGCLSLPGISDKVDRPASIRVRAQDLEGKPFELAAEGWLARAICHEVDHLDGILFVERLTGLRRERARRLLRRLVSQQEAPEWKEASGLS